MADHPGVIFKDGPSGRRAALAYGPDIWEVIKFLREVGGDKPTQPRLILDYLLQPFLLSFLELENGFS